MVNTFSVDRNIVRHLGETICFINIHFCRRGLLTYFFFLTPTGSCQYLSLKSYLYFQL